MKDITLLGGDYLYRWDTQRKIAIESDEPFSYVHFSQGSICETVEPHTENDVIVADIPNTLLQRPGVINVFLFNEIKNLTNSQLRTLERFELVLIDRPKPPDYVYVETPTVTLHDHVVEALRIAHASGQFAGHSPVITASKSGRATTIYADGIAIAIVLDGKDGTVGASAWADISGKPSAFPPSEHVHSQYLTEESDPVFNASAAKGITATDISNWNSKPSGQWVTQQLAGKQDSISDLATIRAGASAGATALQSFTETDPTVPSFVKSITEEDIAKWNAAGGEIFWAVYDETTFAEVKQAVDDGKLIFCWYVGNLLVYSGYKDYSATSHVFTYTYGANIYNLYLNRNDSWSSNLYALVTKEDIKHAGERGLYFMELSASEKTPTNNGDIVWVYE